MEKSDSKKVWFLGEVKLGYHRNDDVEGSQIMCSTDAMRFFRQLMDISVIEHHEEFWVGFTNRANRVIAFLQLSKGSLTGTVVDVKQIMQVCLNANACGVLVMHNHPSGNLSPSEEDKKVTQKIKAACALFDVTLLDHIILTKDDYTSFADERML